MISTSRNSINASYTGVTRTGEALSPVDSSGNAFIRGKVYEAYSGGLGFDNRILNFDAVSDFELSNSTMHLAWGAEFRQENFKIFAGEEYSYRSYGGYNPNYCTTTNGATTCTVEYTGGIQVFPGFAPGAAVDANRDALGLYFEADFEWENDFTLNLAARFEDYSDFGDVLTAKVSGRKGLGDNARNQGFGGDGLPRTITASDPLQCDLDAVEQRCIAADPNLRQHSPSCARDGDSSADKRRHLALWH